MTKLLRQNIDGTDFTMAGCTLTGTCSSAASDYIKTVTLTDGDILSDGMTVVVDFTNGNTAGTAPASMTIYSSDQVNYFTDSGLTQPFTLAPAGCYEITYTGEGNAYSYISYPVMQVGSVSGPLCDASGNKSSGALWLEGDKVSINYANGCFNVIPQTAGSLTVTAASSVVNGAPVRIGSTVRVLFTQDLTGAANAGLVLTYNGVGIPVMVGKNGSLGALLPFDVGGGTYKYLQAYTTLEMTYDGTQFIVLGNPVVISNSDYTVYTDGSNTYSQTFIDRNIGKTLNYDSGGTALLVLLGKTTFANVAQAFTQLEFNGGRIDGWFGKGVLFLAQNNLINGKSYIFQNAQVFVTQKDNQLYVYLSMDTYCRFFVTVKSTSNFEVINQIVSAREGTDIWVNNWIEI